MTLNTPSSISLKNIGGQCILIYYSVCIIKSMRHVFAILIPIIFLIGTICASETIITKPVMRESSVINGRWMAHTADSDNMGVVPLTWGYTFSIPGIWGRKDGNDIKVNSINGVSDEIFNAKDLDKLWVSRKWNMPMSWNGRAVYLKCASVGERALVYIDKKYVGTIARSGNVNISDHVIPGHDHEISILIDAIVKKRSVETIELNSTEKMADRVVGIGSAAEWGIKDNGPISPFPGVIADVIIESRPLTIYIDNHQVATRWEDKTISVRCVVDNTSRAEFTGRVKIECARNGTIEKEFVGPVVNIGLGKCNVLTADGKWPDVSPWSPVHPNLYNYSVSLVAESGELIDCIQSRLGFRELVAVESHSI